MRSLKIFLVRTQNSLMQKKGLGYDCIRCPRTFWLLKNYFCRLDAVQRLVVQQFIQNIFFYLRVSFELTIESGLFFANQLINLLHTVR